MIKLYRALSTFGLFALFAIPFAAHSLLGLSEVWAFLLGFVLFFLGCRQLGRLEVMFDQMEHDRRAKPVMDAIERCPLMIGNERDFKRELVRQLADSLRVYSKPEAPLPTGTRVDAYMAFADEDWYISIKRGLGNQQRLVLQGEIEDILLHAPRKDRDLWIVVVIGIHEDMNANEMAQFDHLIEYAAHRSVSRTRMYQTREDKREVHIEFAPVTIPSKSPVPAM